MLRRFILAIVMAVALPATALAVPPPYVTGLRAQLEGDNDVRVTWDASPDTSVVRYRLYYSSESILESEGLYDDYEETGGPENTYVFEDPPRVPRLYVTVLAVNGAGEESAAFIEEVAIDLVAPTSSASVPTSSAGASASSVQAAPPPPASSSIPAASSSVPAVNIPAPSSVPPPTPGGIPAWREPPEDGFLHLLLAEAVNPVQVRLTFSELPTIDDPDMAPQAFAITEPSGAQLVIRQITLSGTTVLADTAMQTRGTVYRVNVSEPLMGGGTQPLDAIDRVALFTGHADALALSSPASSSAAASVRDVEGFRLRATPRTDGTYDVYGQWQSAVPENAVAIIVKQSMDGGRTFSPPETLSPDIAGVQITGAQPGRLTVWVSIRTASGDASPGVSDTILLPGSAPTGSVTPPAVKPPVPPAPEPDGLPSSGAGLLAIGTSLLGAGLGLRRMRRKSA